MNHDSEHSVPFIRDGEPYMEGRFLVHSEDGAIRLVLELGSEVLTSSADDCFEAFCGIRKQLEERRIYPKCAGSVRSVFPSGMSRSMGSGLMAYRLELRHQALTKDLVGIFDDADGLPPSTVEQQEAFFEKWIDSLGS